MKPFFIVNPAAGKGMSRRDRKIFQNEVLKIFPQAEIQFTQKEGKNSAEVLARQAQKEGFSPIIGYGGDGTFNAIVNGIDLRDENIVVGMIPAGTGNDLVSVLGIPLNWKEALLTIRKFFTMQIDLGIVNGRIFVNTTSFGLDARVNQRATRLKPLFRKLKISQLAYVAGILPEIFKMQNCFEAEIALNDTNLFTGKFSIIAITNSYRYGGGFKPAPFAKIDDGYLDICLAGPVISFAIPYYALLLKKGTHLKISKFQHFQFKSLIIKTHYPVIWQVDGEEMEPQKEFSISILPKALRVIIPKKPAG